MRAPLKPAVYTASLSFTAVPPFDFELSARTFSGGDETLGGFQDGRYWEVIEVNGAPMLATITSSGTIGRPRLPVRLQANRPITNPDRRTARLIVTRLFNLDLNLKPFYADMRADPIMASIVHQLRGLRNRTTPMPFEALVSSIIEQQVSLAASRGMEEKLIRNFGAMVRVGDQTYVGFPSPQRLARASLAELLRCHLSHRKAEYIRDAARLIAGGKLDLEKFRSYPDIGTAIEELSQVRGIGTWTAEMMLLRGLQKPEAIPADDIGLQRNVSHYYYHDRRITARQVRRLAQRWGRWKGLAAFYLIVAHMKGVPVPG